MKNLVKFQGVTFDDWVGGTEGFYSQICKDCAIEHSITRSLSSIAGEETCGVEGCDNEADFYIDMVMFEEEHGE